MQPEVIHLGSVTFQHARRVQEERAELLRRGKSSEAIIVCEHPPTLTAGRRSSLEERTQAAVLAQQYGFDYVDCDRGGRITYHGPGQIVFYPIVDLRTRGLGVKRYIQILLEAVACGLGQLGCLAFASSDRPGVWCGKIGSERKIAAIGVRVDRGISLHGVSVNFSTDLEVFSRFSPCGFSGTCVTSLEREVSSYCAKDQSEALQHFVSSFVAALTIGPDLECCVGSLREIREISV